MTVPQVRLYTCEEFEKLAEFGEGYELIAGEVIKKPVPTFQHTAIANKLARLYNKFDPDFLIGGMYVEAQVRIGEGYEPIPDLSFWTAQRLPSTNLKSAAPYPDLAVEIWYQRDLEHPTEAKRKISLYLAAGVRLVWIINPEKETVEIYQVGNDLEPAETVQKEGVLKGGVLIPNFEVALADLLG